MQEYKDDVLLLEMQGGSQGQVRLDFSLASRKTEREKHGGRNLGIEFLSFNLIRVTEVACLFSN